MTVASSAHSDNPPEPSSKPDGLITSAYAPTLAPRAGRPCHCAHAATLSRRH
ncbi:MAG: hypothetical protein KJZ65_03350 [Phycisphaerales bacterium]|nr:hypothetical protein [Phycisphaerales bacterium]